MMWTSHDRPTVGFVFFVGFCVRFAISFEGTFTDLPVNQTAKEGDNIEMACAFQSRATSVYLEMQWWFIRAPEEPTDSEEEEVEPEEMDMVQPDPDDEGTKISTVRVQGNNISHKLQLSRIGESDEGLYECRVTRADYGEIAEYKAQAWLKVNATARPRRPPPPPSANKSSSPLHLTDKKPRKSSGSSPDQRVEEATSTSHTTSSKTAQHNPSSGTRTSYNYGLAALLLACGLVTDVML